MGWIGGRNKEIEQLRKQMKRLQRKISLLQLYPSDRGMLREVKQAHGALKAVSGDASASRSVINGFFATFSGLDPAAPPSVIVSGPVRSGKSTVSKLVALQSSARYLQFDLLKHLWVGVSAQTHDDALLAMVIEALCVHCGRGMVIDGSSLVFNGVRPAAAMIEQFKASGLATVLVGSAEASVEDKIAALLSHHRIKKSWTSQIDDDALRSRAEQIVSLSVAARRIAGETGIPYFELRLASFGSDVRHAVNAIIDQHGFA